MPEIVAITSVAQLILDLVNSGRAALKERREAASLINPKICTAIREYAVRLRVDARELEKCLVEPPSGDLKEVWQRFSRDLGELSFAVEALNLSLVDVYQPGLGTELARAFGDDSAVYGYLEFAPFSERSRKPASGDQHRRFLELQERFERLDLWPDVDTFPVSTRGEAISALQALGNSLTAVESLVGEFIRENWKPGQV